LVAAFEATTARSSGAAGRDARASAGMGGGGLTGPLRVPLGAGGGVAPGFDIGAVDVAVDPGAVGGFATATDRSDFQIC
jgi:hypothetical protein